MSEYESRCNGYPTLLTKKQVAELFSASTRTIDRWLLTGEIPPRSKLVIGGSVRFRTAVLMTHITSTGTNGDDS